MPQANQRTPWWKCGVISGGFRASLARRAPGLSGAEAIPWVRHLLPHAVETPEQQRLLLQDEGV
jgi:hypothetical protein